MIQVYYAYSSILQNVDNDNLISKLSPEIIMKSSRLKRQEDKNILLISNMLLLNALYENGYNSNLGDLQYSKTGRPSFPGSLFDFNISHTDNCAVVVFSSNYRVGIDIERIIEIDFSDFKDYFSIEQWKDIYSAEDKLNRFYYYWTLIESGVKADGRGLSLITEKNIKMSNSILLIGNVIWYYKHFSFDQLISCCITSDQRINSIELKHVTSF